jgi:hypothetical protein
MRNDKCQTTDVRRAPAQSIKRWGLSLLVLGVMCAGLFTGCSTLPPAEFWTWSAQDSTQIMAIVAEWKETLKSRIEENIDLSDPIVGSGALSDTSTYSSLHKAMKDKKLRPASMPRSFFFPHTFYRTFDSLHMQESLITVKDTTVTVRLNESFWGHVTIITDSIVRFVKDTTINDIPFKKYDSTFSPAVETVTTAWLGTSERYIEIEPTDKVKRDHWVIKRLSGGARIACPDEATAPYLGGIQLLSGTERRDTLVLRPDSLRVSPSSHWGMQGLYARDSLLSYSTTDAVSLYMHAVALFGNLWWSPADVMLFLHVPDPNDATKSVRRLVKPIAGRAVPDSATFTIPTAGLAQAYVEVVPISSLTEPGASFTTRLWGILLDIK